MVFTHKIETIAVRLARLGFAQVWRVIGLTLSGSQPQSFVSPPGSNLRLFKVFICLKVSLTQPAIALGDFRERVYLSTEGWKSFAKY